MKHWERRVRRTAVAMLSVILLGGSIGISAQASSQGPAPEPAQNESGAGTTTVRGMDTPGGWIYQQVPVGTKEADLYSRFPSELKVKAVVKEGSSDATGVTVLQIVSELADAYTSSETGDITVDVVKWIVDTSIEGCTGSNFDSSRDGNVYFYTPKLADKDREGNTLRWNKADLPFITVVVGNGGYGINMLEDPDPGTDPEGPELNMSFGQIDTHGLVIVAESEEDADNIGMENSKTKNNFILRNGGNFGVYGSWSMVDAEGKLIPANSSPVIRVVGSTDAKDPAHFTILFMQDTGVKIDTYTGAEIVKPIIRVEGYCEVELVASQDTIFQCGFGANAIEVSANSTVNIVRGNGTNFNIRGPILNNGTLNFNRKNALSVESVDNNGTFNIQYTNNQITGPVTNRKAMTFAKDSSLEVGSTFVNFGNAKIEFGEKSQLTTGEFTNEGDIAIPRSVAVATKNGDFKNNGKLKLGGESDVPGGTLEPGEGTLTVDGSMVNNSQDLDIGKQGRIEVKNNFTNTGRVSVSNWTLPEAGVKAPTLPDGGTLLVGKEGDPEIDNSGTIDIGEGGLLTSNNNMHCVLTNSGVLRMANVKEVGTVSGGTVPSCLGTGIKLSRGINVAGEESGDFYLTDITSDMIVPMEDIAYDGTNHYNTLWSKCKYLKVYNEPEDPEDPTSKVAIEDYRGIVFQVTPASGWGVDLYNNEEGTGSVNKAIRFSSKGDANGNYYVVYKHANRRKAPAASAFHMAPATMTIDVNSTGKEISKDHPDYKTVFNWNPEEEEVRKGYSLGETVEIKIALAIEARVGDIGKAGESLHATVKKVDNGEFLTDTGRKKLKDATYTLNFDNLGMASTTIKISTLANGVPIEPGTYAVEIQYQEEALYDENKKITVENETVEISDNARKETREVLEPTEAMDLYVLRTFPEIDLSRYTKEYTYGDEIENPSIADVTALVRNYYGNASLDCEWYKTDDLEKLKKQNEEIQEAIKKDPTNLALKDEKAEYFVGTEFPTKEWLENNGDYKGIVAGDYILRVIVGDDYDDNKKSNFSAPGEVYQRIHVNTKLATLKIDMDPGPSKVYGDPDEPIEYTAEGLIGDDTLNGELARARDRDNVNSSGEQGDAQLDKVGAYLINPGTINTNLNPNYEIKLANSNYQFQILPKDLNWNTNALIVAEQDNRYKVYGGLTLRGLVGNDGDYVGVTYDNIVVSEDGKSLEITNPKVIDIFGNEETKYSSNYNPPRSDTIPIDDSIYTLRVTEGSLTLSQTLQAAGHTAKGVTDRLTTNIKSLRTEKLGYTSDSDYKIYDVKVVRENGEVVEDIFQKGGLIVTIPYPEGTSKSTHNFVANHMISSQIKGAEAPGNIERYSGTGGTDGNGTFYKIEKTDEGLVIKTTGLSPVAIAWAPITNVPGSEDPNNPDDPNNPNTPNNPNNPSDSNNGNNGNNNNNGNGSGSGTNNNNNGNGSSTNNNNNGTTTKNPNSTTTRTSGVNTGDNAPILFYSVSALVALLLLIFIICMVRARRKEE